MDFKVFKGPSGCEYNLPENFSNIALVLFEYITDVAVGRRENDELLKLDYSYEDVYTKNQIICSYYHNLSYCYAAHYATYVLEVLNYYSFYKIYKLYLEALCNKEKADSYEESINLDGDVDISLDLSFENNEGEDERVDNVYDGLVLSLANKGKVDINYISRISNFDLEEVVKGLDGYIYKNPCKSVIDDYEGYETSDEYLSGNMYEKLKEARLASKENPIFNKNIKAIEEVYPKSIDVDDIYVSLGSPWIPTSVIDDFIIHILGEPDSIVKDCIKTKHNKLSGTWEVNNEGRYNSLNVAYKLTWGTSRCSALRILENSLNMHKVVIYDTEYGMKADGSYGDIKVINKQETALAQEKQRKMEDEFKSWVFSDLERSKKLKDIYESEYASFVKRRYDGSFLKFKGMNKDIELFDYQKNAIMRMLFNKNTLLAHDVGSGKTYEMIAAGQELRRMGLSKKNMYVVPNNIVGQWKDSFLELYPSANVLVIDPKTFKKKREVLEKVINEDFDGIIIAYSCFEKINLSQDYKIKMLQKEKLKVMKAQGTIDENTSNLDKLNKSISTKIINLRTSGKIEDDIYFDDLGITRLFIDEAHNFKNVPIKTKMNYVLGINSTGSSKCEEMLNKVHYIQGKGGGVVMATGTPITNSICEVYTIQLYLQRGMLSLMDLESFDSWAGMFGETTVDYEIDVATNSYRLATRFSKFHNLPELTNLLSSVADFHVADSQNGLPLFKGYTDITVNRSKEFEEFLKAIAHRAELVRGHLVDRKTDNMLQITTDGRKAALDLRLFDKEIPYTSESKVGKCVEEIIKIYRSEKDATQLVFCDCSTPKDGFNMYDELKDRLIIKGIPSYEIAYIHDATSEKQKSELYEQFRKGKIRVLIGSSFKLGLGLNVQDKVKALHHLDIPWRPSDMKQREGRILRKGNLNEEVYIYRYVTEGSFDAYSWQLLEIKQKFISDLLNGVLDTRDGNEIDGTVLSYGEIKALAIGNPLIKERVEKINELNHLRILQDKNVLVKLEAQKELLEIPHLITYQKELINKAIEDKQYYEMNNPEVELDTYQKQELEEKRRNIRSILDDAIENNVLIPNERELFIYKGFKVKLPSEMSKDKPYIIVENRGRYKVEMSDRKGNLIRIDNFLKGFNSTIDKYKNRLNEFYSRQQGLQNVVFSKDETVDKIRLLQIEINRLDERLELSYE